MARPYNRWYFTSSDIARICDLTEHSVSALARAGALEPGNLRSLLAFTAEHLADKHKKSLQLEIVNGQAKDIKTKISGSNPCLTQPPDDLPDLVWELHSDALTEAIGISQNSIHSAISRGYFDPGNLLSLVRFALFSARPDHRATLVASLYQTRLANPPLPPNKNEIRLRKTK